LGGSLLQANPEQNGLQDPISTEKSWTWWCVPVIPVTAWSVK
jgi:hypothetical protein